MPEEQHFGEKKQWGEKCHGLEIFNDFTYVLFARGIIIDISEMMDMLRKSTLPFVVTDMFGIPKPGSHVSIFRQDIFTFTGKMLRRGRNVLLLTQQSAYIIIADNNKALIIIPGTLTPIKRLRRMDRTTVNSAKMKKATSIITGLIPTLWSSQCFSLILLLLGGFIFILWRLMTHSTKDLKWKR